jgi:hypothetical protein
VALINEGASELDYMAGVWGQNDEIGCFLCAGNIKSGKEDFIMWSGSFNLNIRFHPACAVDFAVRLMRDAHAYKQAHKELQLTYGPQKTAPDLDD